MKKTLFAIAAVATLAQPALATTFTRDGSTYDYTVEQKGKTMLITGQIVDTKEPFRFRVTGERVTGSIAGRWVSFSTRDVVASKPATVSTEIAAR